jgi:hypothetical protein
MTLTHIIPSLRRTIASPLRRALWPECSGTTCLHAIDPNHLHRAAPTAAQDEQQRPLTSCGK